MWYRARRLLRSGAGSTSMRQRWLMLMRTMGKRKVFLLRDLVPDQFADFPFDHLLLDRGSGIFIQQHELYVDRILKRSGIGYPIAPAIDKLVRFDVRPRHDQVPAVQSIFVQGKGFVFRYTRSIHSLDDVRRVVFKKEQGLAPQVIVLDDILYGQYFRDTSNHYRNNQNSYYNTHEGFSATIGMVHTKMIGNPPNTTRFYKKCPLYQ